VGKVRPSMLEQFLAQAILAQASKALVFRLHVLERTFCCDLSVESCAATITLSTLKVKKPILMCVSTLLTDILCRHQRSQNVLPCRFVFEFLEARVTKRFGANTRWCDSIC
jgi:hypothetical protein